MNSQQLFTCNAKSTVHVTSSFSYSTNIRSLKLIYTDSTALVEYFQEKNGWGRGTCICV